MKCERCGQDSPFAIFDSSTGPEFFCDECHKKDMIRHNNKKMKGTEERGIEK